MNVLPKMPSTHALRCGEWSGLVKMSASWDSVATWTSRIWPLWTTSCAKCFRMSMCLARSRPPMTWFPHSMHRLPDVPPLNAQVAEVIS